MKSMTNKNYNTSLSFRMRNPVLTKSHADCHILIDFPTLFSADILELATLLYSTVVNAQLIFLGWTNC